MKGVRRSINHRIKTGRDVVTMRLFSQTTLLNVAEISDILNYCVLYTLYMRHPTSLYLFIGILPQQNAKKTGISRAVVVKWSTMGKLRSFRFSRRIMSLNSRILENIAFFGFWKIDRSFRDVINFSSTSGCWSHLFCRQFKYSKVCALLSSEREFGKYNYCNAIVSS